MTWFRQITIQNYLKLDLHLIRWFFAVFYLVGITGMLIPQTFPLFKKLIPVAILLTTAAVLLFHQAWNNRSVAMFVFIFTAGFIVEAIGTNKGYIFGEYTYGESLGIMVFGTPLIIGINWLLLVYLTSAVTENFNICVWMKVILASFLMLIYDFLIEPVAPVLDMWSWTNNTVPLQNYLAWIILSLMFHSLIKIFRIKTHNDLAPALLLYQLVFFLTLLLTLT